MAPDPAAPGKPASRNSSRKHHVRRRYSLPLMPLRTLPSNPATAQSAVLDAPEDAPEDFTDELESGAKQPCEPTGE